MTKTSIRNERIGSSSPRFSLQDFTETYLWMHKNFFIWEIVAEGKHHPNLITEKIPELRESYPLKIQVHSSISDINIGSISERIRSASVREIISCMKLLSEIDEEILTIHPGVLSPVVSNEPGILYEKTRMSVLEINSEAEEFGVKVCLENMPAFNFSRYRKPGEIVELIDDTELLFTFDVGHANSTKTIREFMESSLMERLNNVHLHDNNGAGDPHMTPGEGSINIRKIVSEIERSAYSGNYILESRSYESSHAGKKFLLGN